jgi:hypothetical protein
VRIVITVEWDAARTAREREHAERLLDEALGETFPASDAVSVFVPPPRDAHGYARVTRPAP